MTRADELLPWRPAYTAAYNRHRAASADPRTPESARRAHLIAEVVIARCMIAELETLASPASIDVADSIVNAKARR